ncbi:MAG: hypothetical protein ACOC9J_02500 [Persicimonas sp.]
MPNVINNYRNVLWLFAALSLSIAGVVGFAQPAVACPGGDKAQSCPFADEDVEVVAENTDDGAQLTLRSEDAESIEKIQKWASRFEADGKKAKHLQDKGASAEVEQLSDGARVTVSSENSKLVERFQTKFARKADGQGCGKHAKRHKEGHDCGDHKEAHGEQAHQGHKKGHDCDKKGAE